MINPTAAADLSAHQGNAYAQRLPVQTLGQDDFIKILVAQLASQDPLNPQKDAEFIGQMAQFSALESTKSMQMEIQTLRANSLIGHTVEVKLNQDANIIGEVTGVQSEKGEPKIVIGGATYSLKDVLRVERSSIFDSPATSVPNEEISTPIE